MAATWGLTNRYVSLPRKAPAKAGAASRGARRFVPAPTFLGEPGTLADAGELQASARDQRTLRLSARGVITDVTLSMRFDR